jgi:hypothetical protein
VFAHEADRYAVLCLALETRADCEAETKEIRALYKKAYKGDYQARRNLAWMLQNGSVAARKDPIASCSWRMIIATSKSPKVDNTDFANMNLVCGRLSPQDLAQAKVQAMTLVERMETKDPIDEEIIDGTGLDSTAEPL